MAVVLHTPAPPCTNPCSWQHQSKYGLVKESFSFVPAFIYFRWSVVI